MELPNSVITVTSYERQGFISPVIRLFIQPARFNCFLEETTKLHIAYPLWNPSVTDSFPSQRDSHTGSLFCHDVIGVPLSVEVCWLSPVSREPSDAQPWLCWLDPRLDRMRITPDNHLTYLLTGYLIEGLESGRTLYATSEEIVRFLCSPYNTWNLISNILLP